MRLMIFEFPYFLIGPKSSKQSQKLNCLKTVICLMIETICLQYHSNRKNTLEQNEKVFHKADLQL